VALGDRRNGMRTASHARENFATEKGRKESSSRERFVSMS
jgi:hypothetical protein